MESGRGKEISPGEALVPLLALLPRPVAELGARCLAHRLIGLHPGLRDRLVQAEGKSFLLKLSDMPFNALLEIRRNRPILALLGKPAPVAADVSIHGSGEALLALLEGRVDGDALFFSRDLRVEGDTEALLILRNALDSEQINMQSVIFSFFGPFSGIASLIATPAEKLAMRFLRDMRRWRGT